MSTPGDCGVDGHAGDGDDDLGGRRRVGGRRGGGGDLDAGVEGERGRHTAEGDGHVGGHGAEAGAADQDRVPAVGAARCRRQRLQHGAGGVRLAHADHREPHEAQQCDQQDPCDLALAGHARNGLLHRPNPQGFVMCCTSRSPCSPRRRTCARFCGRPDGRGWHQRLQCRRGKSSQVGPRSWPDTHGAWRPPSMTDATRPLPRHGEGAVRTVARWPGLRIRRCVRRR